MTRIEREKSTVGTMIALYCRGVHQTGDGLCEACQRLRDYAFARLDPCPYAAGKPTCARCQVHCYAPRMRAEVIAVMRYSGPRMAHRHPLLAAMHQLDSWRRAPHRPPRLRE